jgi:hypothetical protein
MTTKALQKLAVETFFILQWKGSSGKSAAGQIGHSQATLRRWAKDFENSPLISSISEIQTLRSKVYWAIHKEKVDVLTVLKILLEIERLNNSVSKLVNSN